MLYVLKSCTSSTKGCGRWGGHLLRVVLAVEYVHAVEGTKPRSSSIGSQANAILSCNNVTLLALLDIIRCKVKRLVEDFFTNCAIIHLDLWVCDLETGPWGAGVPRTLPTKFGIRRPFRFPSRWRYGTGSTHDGVVLPRRRPHKKYTWLYL